MGFFNNIKNIKDHVIEYETIQNIDQLQVVFDTIDDQAEKEKEKKKEEMKHFESLFPMKKLNISEFREETKT